MTELAIEVHDPLMSALELSPTGLRLPAGLAFDTWAGLGEKIMLITQGVMWALGDWYEYGEATYGEKAAQALDSDRWSFKTFVNAGYVARRFPESSRRRDSQLTYSHYDAVAALEPAEADALLDRAEDEGLSVHQLRQEVRARRRAEVGGAVVLMDCLHCGGLVTPRRQIHANGAQVIIQRCSACLRPPKDGVFVSKRFIRDWESLPIDEDYTSQSEPCCVKDCPEQSGTEWHHFAPRHLFTDCEQWPAGPLCRFHHRLWHERTRTGSFYERRPTQEYADSRSR